MERKLFCEISPFTYRLSMEKEILKRHVQDMLRKTLFAKERTEESLPVVIYRHNSLIRRRLGNVNMQLQENKATNLALAVKHIDGLVIRPGETFSVWRLIGRTTKRKGYKEGLTIAKGKPSRKRRDSAQRSQCLLENCNGQMKYRIGFVPQQDLLHEHGACAQNPERLRALRLRADRRGNEKIHSVMEILGLTEGADGLISRNPGGQKKRISIGTELISNPDLFILDEPDSGLDGVIAELFS